MKHKARKSTRSRKPRINFPTILTLIRIILVLPMIILLLTDDPGCRGVALVIFIIAALTDKLDGDLARKHNQVTDLGKFLDPIADKMLTNLAFLGLVKLDLVPLAVFALILVRDYAVDGVRMQAASRGKVIAAGWTGKWKTTTQMVSIIFFFLYLIFGGPTLLIIATILLYVALALTLISGGEYLIKAARTKR